MNKRDNPDGWKIRAIQLDLARQRETIDTILEFISFSAEWGYNTLFLYLEGVVRTTSFPYRPADQSYTPEEMHEVVAAAAKAGISVVPCISTLGHAEHFVTTPELEHLEAPAKFGGPMFDPGNDGTYEFLASYLHDIAECFPAPHMHIGCDEAWRLGRSPSCLARRANGETYADLLIKHIERMVEICSSLNKRVWIWSDLLEYLSDDEISRIPRSVLMCSWHYITAHIDRTGTCGHFDNLRRRDWLSLYEKLGFEVLVCPAAGNLIATGQLTRYARRHNVAGGLQTMWGLSASFLPALLPCVAATGALWQDPSQDLTAVTDHTLCRLFPLLNNAERLAIRGLLGKPSTAFSSSTRNVVPLNDTEYRDVDDMDLRIAVLETIEDSRLTDLESRILTDLKTGAKGQALNGRFRRLLPAVLHDPSAQDIAQDTGQIVMELRELAEARAEHWKEWRPGIAPDRASPALEQRASDIEAFLDQIRSTEASRRLLLYLDLFLWESYSAPNLCVELRHGNEWHEIFEGPCKPRNLEMSQFRCVVPGKWPHEMPDAIRMSISGFGGEGIRYVSIDIGDQLLVPESVIETAGNVTDPERVLVDDAFPCYLGTTDTVGTLADGTDDAVSSLTVGLKQA